MSDIEQVLDDGLNKLMENGSSVDECLSAHPQHDLQLRPLLQNAAVLIHHNDMVHASSLFRARARSRLLSYMHSHPHRQTKGSFLIQRFAIGLAVLFMALLSAGTVHAQGALPGDVFYVWKLTSERVWRGLSPNDNHVDLMLANRRVDEIVATAGDPTYQARAVKGYEKILLRLRSDSEKNTEEILSTLESNQRSLKDAGLSVPQLDDYLSHPVNADGRIIPDVPATLLPEIETPLLNP